MEDRGEMRVEVVFLGATCCCGDLTGDSALGTFPGRQVGSLGAVEPTGPGVCVDGPIFAGGCNSGAPLAYINLLIKLSCCKVGDASGGGTGAEGAACRSSTGVPFA